MTRWLRLAFVYPIKLYQRFLSPLKPPMCRFEPTCSHYAHEAVLTHGILKGSCLATWRILRCQPFTEPGPDPVPPKGRWRAEARPGEAEDAGHP